jgi:hypothetical protein
MAVGMKNAVLWDVAPCESCKNRRFGVTCRLHLQGRRNYRVRKSVVRLLTEVVGMVSEPCEQLWCYSICGNSIHLCMASLVSDCGDTVFAGIQYIWVGSTQRALVFNRLYSSGTWLVVEVHCRG